MMLKIKHKWGNMAKKSSTVVMNADLPIKNKATKSRFEALGLEKLALSGLDFKDAKLLKIDIISGLETLRTHKSFKPLAALRFNYLSPDGSLMSSWPGTPPYVRVRYLEEDNTFAKQTKEKARRYAQPPETAPCVYFPQNIDWVSIIEDPTKPIIITEGELKAAKACKEGFPTLGLGGVYSYRSTKLGLTILPILNEINWQMRYVYIVYDSDYRTNPLVLTAINGLAEELLQLGAFPHLVPLPDVVDGQKTGLDDFLVSSKHAVETFKELLHEALPLTLAKPLWRLNERYCYIMDPGLVLDQKTGSKLQPNAFKDHIAGTHRFEEHTIKPDGTVSHKFVPATGPWLRWPLRCQADKLTYKPGKDDFVEDNGLLLRNTWKGWGCEPKKGDTTPFKELIKHIFQWAEPEAVEWFMRWCAYPLQHPGVKMFSSAVIYGIKHGTGKSLIGYTMGKIYGRNFTEIKQGDLHASFNDWAENKQFILGDDVSGSNKRQDGDMLKTLITQKELRVNPKYVPSYVVPDCINYLFTSNHPDSFFLEDGDRRFFIHEVAVGPLPEEFYVEYSLWLDSGGAEAVFQYLLDYPLEGFNPAGPAFRTAAKSRMINDVKSDLGAWVQSLLEDPQGALRVNEMVMPGDLFTSKQLLALYDPTGKTGTTANGLGRELRRAGFNQVCGGRPVKVDADQSRYYAVLNTERWVRATAAEVTHHIKLQVMPTPVKKY